MKNKEIKERINQAVINDIPDVFNRIDLDKINIEPRESKKWGINFLKTIRYATVAVVLTLTVFFSYNFFFAPIQDSTTPLESEMEIIGFQTITGSILLEDFSVEELNYTEDDYLNSLELSVTESIDVNDYLDDINPFMHLMETIINQDETIMYEEFQSDDENYSYAFSYTSSDLAKNEVIYKVYYNQSEETTEGEIRFNDYNYQFTKNNQNIKIEIDQNNYVNINDLSTNNQQKFAYQLYKNGLKALDTDIEIYRVNKNIEVKTNINKNGLSMNLYIKRNFYSNLDEFEVDYEITENQNQVAGKFNVNLEFDSTINTYKYRYIMENNGTAEKPRGPINNPGRNNNPFGVIIF